MKAKKIFENLNDMLKPKELSSTEIDNWNNINFQKELYNAIETTGEDYWECHPRTEGDININEIEHILSLGITVINDHIEIACMFFIPDVIETLLNSNNIEHINTSECISIITRNYNNLINNVDYGEYEWDQITNDKDNSINLLVNHIQK